jgi:type II secretory pathway pseudopilin PulG
MQEKSFTVLEMIVVVIIMGILAGVVLNFTPLKENVLDKEAQANLKLIRAAERIYRMEMDGYVGCANTLVVNNNLKLCIPTSRPNWNYKVEVVSATSFTGKSQRNVTGGRSWCINQITEDPYQTGCTW